LFAESKQRPLYFVEDERVREGATGKEQPTD
jgi:hypothetical protein